MIPKSFLRFGMEAAAPVIQAGGKAAEAVVPTIVVVMAPPLKAGVSYVVAALMAIGAFVVGGIAADVANSR